MIRPTEIFSQNLGLIHLAVLNHFIWKNNFLFHLLSSTHLLLSCLVLFCLLLSLLCLCLCLSLSPCGVAVVLLCGVVCACVCCVAPWKPRRVHSKRASVHIQNVPVCTCTTRTCWGTHGDVSDVHTGTFWMDTTVSERVIDSSAYQNLPTQVHHVTQRFTRSNHWILQIQVWEWVENNACPILLVIRFTW